MSTSVLAVSIGTGGAALMAIRFGEGRKPEGLELFNQSMMLSTLVMVLLTVATLLNLEELSRLLGANDHHAGELLVPQKILA